MAIRKQAYKQRPAYVTGKEARELKLGKSTNISRAFYNENTRELRIHFNKGPKYSYSNIDPRVIGNWQKSGSVGKYFNKHIRNNPSVAYERSNWYVKRVSKNKKHK